MTDIQLRPYQVECKKAIKTNYDKGIKEQLIVMATGCHAINTEILMYDGSIKLVQDILVGDTLMGDDSTPREVLSLYRGNQTMVKIIPNKGNPFIVNEDHILSLRKTNTPGKYPGMSSIVNISVKDYVKTNRHFKHLYKLYRTGVDFSRNFYDEFKYITPYFLGLWIGDGSSSRPIIVSNEDEVDDYFYSEFKKYCTNRYHKGNELYAYYFGTDNGKFEHNPLWNELTRFIKDGSKYLTTESVAFRFVDRCELLAGLIDSDGYLGDGSYDFINKNISISRTVLFLAQSIGLYAVMKKCNKQCTNNGKWGEYYRVQISGNINIIPCKVSRKKAQPRLQKKDPLMTGFRIEYLKSDSYYGFELNDNHLYCMGDFTVTHNTGKRLASVELMKHFNRSLFIAHREELIGQAYDEISKFWPMQVGIIKGPTFELDKKIVVASVQTLQNRLERIKPETFDYVVIDECHNYLSPSYLRTIRHFKPKLRTAWTATPKRLDGLSLTNIAQEVVFQYRIEDGIKDGWLAGVEAYQIRTNTNIADVRRVAGDFNQGQLSERVDSRSRNAMIATKYLHYARGRQAIAYCVDVKHSYNLRDILREHGVNAETIVGDPQLCPNRRELINRFKNGEIDVLTNCEVLCLDLETEILTNNGWKNYETISYSDKVANYKFDGKIYFKKPEIIVSRQLYEYERMVSINSKGSNIRVTNTHRMIYKNNRTDPEWNKTAAGDLVNKTWIYPVAGNAVPSEIIVEQEFHSDRKRAVSANAYNLRKKNGYSHIDSINEARRRYDLRTSMKYKNPSELTFDECRLIGFWIGDGSINKLIRDGVEYTLSQSKAYPNIIKWIDDLLLSLNIHNIKREKEGHYVWSLNRGTSSINKMPGIYHLEPYLKKDVNELLWGLNNDQWRAFIEGLWYADGLHGNADKIPESKRIYSVNYELLSLIQAISVCRGLNATISLGENHKKNPKFLKIWIINIEERTTRSVFSKNPINKLQYEEFKDEKVWCVKTETRNIITRRDGQICIMGNTEGFDYHDIGCILMGRPTQSERLYIQAIGRGTRLKSQEYIDKFGSNTCIVLDFVDNSGRLSLVNSYELEKDKPIEDRMFLPKEHKEKLLALKEERERKIKIQTGQDQKINLLKLPEFKVWNSEKMLEPATEKQINWIKQMGIWQEDVEYTKSMASELISAQPAKEWQIRWLAENKYDVSNGCSLGQFQRVKYSFELKNKFAMDEKEKNKILNKLKNE